MGYFMSVLCNFIADHPLHVLRSAWLWEHSAVDTTASAGGLSILQLANAAKTHRTPPGFCRLYFNFTATKRTPGLGLQSGKVV